MTGEPSVQPPLPEERGKVEDSGAPNEKTARAASFFCVASLLFLPFINIGIFIPDGAGGTLVLALRIIYVQAAILAAVIIPYLFCGIKGIFKRLGIKRLSRREKISLLFLPPALVCLTLSVNGIFTFLCRTAGFDIPPADLTDAAIRQPLPSFIVIVLTAVFLSPVAEELAYRHSVFLFLKEYIGVPVSICAASVMFALAHGFMVQSVSMFALGAALQILYIRSGGNTAYSIMLHSGYNFWSCAALAALRFIPQLQT